jgi:hypothetical protein
VEFAKRKKKVNHDIIFLLVFIFAVPNIKTTILEELIRKIMKYIQFLKEINQIL